MTTQPLFTPKTERLEKLAKMYPDVITKLSSFFDKPTIVYIDYANVLGWGYKLSWAADIKRTKQLLDSFLNIKKVRFYYGTIKGDLYSKALSAQAKKYYPDYETKDVKIRHLSIDVSSISLGSTDLLKQFIRMPLLKEFTIADIEYLNNKLKELNAKGQYHIKDKKSNFDVEIGIRIWRDKIDFPEIETFVLWSGDCDFEYPLLELKKKRKNVIVFAPRGHVASELSDLGAVIYEIRPLKYFICWPKQIDIAI